MADNKAQLPMDKSSSEGAAWDDVEKKNHGDHVEDHDITSQEHTEATDPRIIKFTEKEQRKIIHKVDRRLLVTLGALYCVSLMDRTNLSAANIAG